MRGMNKIKTLTFIPIKIALIFIIFFQMIYFLQIKNSEIILSSSPQHKDEAIGYLQIPKIKMNLPFYSIHDKRNNVDQNIEVLSSSKEGRLVIAGHSGVGKVSFFNPLVKLEEEDKIYIIYKEQKYTYKVVEKYKEKKTGYIHIKENKNEKCLILTTCDQVNKEEQLIIRAILV